jgi:hypothetical protein
MKVVVVYESLWDSTAAVARAIAEGFGPDAKAMSTAEASAEAVAGADLIIAGAPVHSLNLPSERTREWARVGRLGPGGAAPDLSHPMMRTWLERLPKGNGRAAAFDTRVKSWYGFGAAPKILAGLRQAGFQGLAGPHGFYVTGHPILPRTNGVLRDGEAERARQWGAELARAMTRLAVR